MRSKPSVLTSEAAVMSIWFICFWPAEMKTSQSAPSWIWVLRVPEESKLKESSYWSLAAANWSPARVRLSVMDAAAKTTMALFLASSLLAEPLPPSVEALLPPQAARPRAAAAAAVPPMNCLLLRWAIVVPFSLPCLGLQP